MTIEEICLLINTSAPSHWLKRVAWPVGPVLKFRDIPDWWRFFAYSQNIDFTESFISLYFTKKVSTVTFSEQRYALSPSQNDKTSSNIDILFLLRAKTRRRVTAATTFSRQNDACSRACTTRLRILRSLLETKQNYDSDVDNGNVKTSNRFNKQSKNSVSASGFLGRLGIIAKRIRSLFFREVFIGNGVVGS